MKKVFIVLFSLILAVTISAQSRYIDGNDDVITASNQAHLNSTRITLMGWVKLDSDYLGTIRSVITRAGGGTQDAYHLAVGNLGRIGFYIRKDATWKGDWNLGSTVLDANKWYHIAGTFNGTSIDVYLDGVFDGGVNDAGDMNINQNAVLQIGHGAGARFKGSLDNVMMWSVGMGTSTIQNMREFEADFERDETVGNIASYNFNEETGNITDGSVYRNHSTIITGTLATDNAPTLR